MARFHGIVGYAETVSTENPQYPGVFVEEITERSYYGDVMSNTRRLSQGDSTNDNVDISNRISIVADAYAYKHFFAIRYIEWMGARWTVSSVEVQHPRLILTIGGIYNGNAE